MSAGHWAFLRCFLRCAASFAALSPRPLRPPCLCAAMCAGRELTETDTKTTVRCVVHPSGLCSGGCGGATCPHGSLLASPATLDTSAHTCSPPRLSLCTACRCLWLPVEWNAALPCQTGVEIDTVTFKGGKLNLREVGSPMIPMWPSFFHDCHAIVVSARWTDCTHGCLPVCLPAILCQHL